MQFTRPTFNGASQDNLRVFGTLWVHFRQIRTFCQDGYNRPMQIIQFLPFCAPPNPSHLVSWQLCGLLLSIVVVYGSIVGLRPTERRLFMGSLVLDRRDFSVLSLGWKSPARQKMRHKMTSHGGDVSQSRRTQGGKYADKVTVVRPSIH